MIEETNIVSEVDNFLQSNNREFSIFENGSFCNIKRIFMKYNTIPASQASCERVFTKAKLVMGSRRQRFEDEEFDKVLFLQCNKPKTDGINSPVVKSCEICKNCAVNYKISTCYF